MIDLKKITILALLASSLGTREIFAARGGESESDEEETPQSIPIQQTTPEDVANNNEPGTTIHTQPEVGNDDEEKSLRNQLRQLQVESEQVADQQRHLEEERHQRTITEARQQLEEKKLKLEEDKRKFEEEKRRFEEEEARDREAASHQQEQTLIFGRTPERIEHNVKKETERAVEGVTELLKTGKWGKKSKKDKKGKRG